MAREDQNRHAPDTSGDMVKILEQAPGMVASFGKWPALALMFYTLSMARPVKLVIKLGAIGALVASTYWLWRHWF